MHLVRLPAERPLPLLQRSWKKLGKFFFVDTKRDSLNLQAVICTFMSPMEKTKIIQRVSEGDCRAPLEACQIPSREAARSSWKSRHHSGHPLQVRWHWQRCRLAQMAAQMYDNRRASQMERIKGLERSGGVIYAEG